MERMWVRRCIVCGKILKKRCKKVLLCRQCYINEWKRLNYNGKRPEKFCKHKEVKSSNVYICGGTK